MRHGAATSEARGWEGGNRGRTLWQDKLKIYETMNETSALTSPRRAPGHVSRDYPTLLGTTAECRDCLWMNLRPNGSGGTGAGDISKYHRSLSDLRSESIDATSSRHRRMRETKRRNSRELSPKVTLALLAFLVEFRRVPS